MWTFTYLHSLARFHMNKTFSLLSSCAFSRRFSLIGIFIETCFFFLYGFAFCFCLVFWTVKIPNVKNSFECVCDLFCAIFPRISLKRENFSIVFKAMKKNFSSVFSWKIQSENFFSSSSWIGENSRRKNWKLVRLKSKARALGELNIEASYTWCRTHA